MKQKIVLFLVAIFTLFSCKKEDTGTPIWRVWYAVQLTPDFDIDITYNSDKYADTGIRDTFNIHDTSYVPKLQANTWIGQRLQSDKELGYHINLNIKELTPYTGRLGVFIYANDTSLLDSVTFPHGTKQINLSGEIPHVFD